MTERPAGDLTPPFLHAVPLLGTSVVAPHLPRILGPTIGREQELATIHQMLLDPGIRLITLLGPGGVGKTRLALEVAKVELPGAKRVWFVDLQRLTDASHVSAAIAEALGLRDSGGPSSPDRLVAWLQSRVAILILDNFEHVLEAGRFLARLIADCPWVTILVTSRVALNVTGEHQVRIHPLDCPAPGQQASFTEVSQSAAVRLFVLRASAVQPEFTLTTSNMAVVTRLCERLDGLPLAIELAAARSRHMGAEALLARLDQRFEMLRGGPTDTPPRMQSLRQAIAWSYDLLTPWEQRLFSRLSVFAGSFSIDAVESVCLDSSSSSRHEPDSVEQSGESFSPAHAMDGLSALIDRSLVELNSLQGEEPRYTMLESLREFGWEQLQGSGHDVDIRTRHVAWCLSVAEAAEQERVGLLPADPRDRLGAERDNIRAALRWLQERNETRTALRLAATLWPLWLERGEVSEGRTTLSSLLATPSLDIPPREWARAAWVNGALAQAQGDHDEAVLFSGQALDLFNQHGDQHGAAAALTTLGLDAMIQGDLDSADRFLADSHARFHSANDPRAGGWALRHQSSVAFRRGDIARAETLAKTGIDIVRATAPSLDLARLLLNLGFAALIQGDLPRAESALTEALPLFQGAGDRWGIADVLQRLGGVAIERGKQREALEALEASRVLFQMVGDPEGLGVVLVQLAWLYRRQHDLDLATEHLGQAMSIARESNNPSRIASARLAEGAVAFDQGDWPRAAAAWDESLSLANQVHDRLAIAAVLEWTAHLAEPNHPDVAACLVATAGTIRSEEHAAIPGLVHADHGALASRLETKRSQRIAEEQTDDCALTLDAATDQAHLILQAFPSPTPRLTPPALGGMHRASTFTLSERERETLQFLAQGRTNRQIADALSISPRTVENHVSHIFEKLGVTSRAAATAYAIHHGLD